MFEEDKQLFQWTRYGMTETVEFKIKVNSDGGKFFNKKLRLIRVDFLTIDLINAAIAIKCKKWTDEVAQAKSLVVQKSFFPGHVSVFQKTASLISREIARVHAHEYKTDMH